MNCSPQNGFLSTGVDAIVKNASVPKGSFYYYFKSKEEYAQDCSERL
nr:helix-turn-helix domain-containing protein [Enterobacter hormaechei]